MFSQFKLLICPLITIQCLNFISCYSNELPSGIERVSGEVSFFQTENSLNVNSQSTKSIVNYQTFNIGENHSVNFQLPHWSSLILNRVVGNNSSNILGNLNSNGRVFLVNPNGILFGPKSFVNVQSLFASTLNISNNDFLNGNFSFKRNKNPSSITNQGNIQTQTYSSFLTSSFQNYGSISSKKTLIGIGDQINLNLGNGAFASISISEELKKKINNYPIVNAGRINSDLEIKALVQKDLFNSIVNNSGIINATNLSNRNGSIELVSNGNIKNNGLVQGNSIYLSSVSLENNGEINSNENLNILLNGANSKVVPKANQRLIHNGISPPKQLNGNFESIEFSLLNQGNFSSNSNLNIQTENEIRNRNGKLTAKNINIQSPKLINEQAVLKTSYSNEIQYIGNTPHFFERWTDESPINKPLINAENNLNLLINDIENQNGNLIAKNDLSIEGKNLLNKTNIKQETERESWVRSSFLSNKTRNVWRKRALNTELSKIELANDAFLSLSGEFQNTGDFIVGNNLNLFAKEFVNGINNPNILSPYETEARIPGSIGALNINIQVGNFLNTGLIESEEDLFIKAQNFENRQRTAKEIENVKIYKGLFNGGSDYVQVEYDRIQPGGVIKGKNVKILSENNLINKGGLIKAENIVELEAKEIRNEAQEEEKVNSFNPGKLGELIGATSYSITPKTSPAEIKAKEININANIAKNIGSNIIGEENIVINTNESFISDWIVKESVKSDKLSFKGFGFERNKQKEQIVQIPRIESKYGDVIINSNGIIKIKATDILANDIFLNSPKIEIKDGVFQSFNENSSFGFNFSKPLLGSLDFQDTKYSITTQKSSNLSARNNLTLNAEQLNIQGSNLLANNQINLSANKININPGIFQNHFYTDGLSLNFGYSGGTNTGINLSLFEGSGKESNLIPSNLLAKEINLNAKEQLNIKASNLNAKDKINFETPKLFLSGEFAPFQSNFDFLSSGINLDIIQGGINLNASFNKEKIKGNKYLSTKINAKEINWNGKKLNQPDFEGIEINNRKINPIKESNFSRNLEGVGFNFNPLTKTIGFSVFKNDLSVFGGIGNASYLGSGYKNWILGGSLNKQNTAQGIFTGYSGIGTFGLNHSTTQGTSKHNVWSLRGNLLGINGTSSFQEGNYIASVISVGKEVLFVDLNKPFAYTCFPKGTLIKVPGKEGNPLKKPIEKTYVRKANKLLKLSFSDQTIIKVTPDHPYWVTNKNSWIKAEDLQLGDSFQTFEEKEIQLIEKEEELGEFRVYNFSVKDNHNYFAENILVHNADYDTELKELQKQAFEFTTLKGEIHQAERISILSSMDQTLNELMEITRNDRGINLTLREFAIRQIDRQKEVISEARRREKGNLIYNQQQLGSQELSDGIIREKFLTPMKEFELLIERGKGGLFTLKDLQNDKKNLQYLLAGEYALARSKRNPLFWLAVPGLKVAQSSLTNSFFNQSDSTRGVVGAALKSGMADLGVTSAGLVSGVIGGASSGTGAGVVVGGLSGAALGFSGSFGMQAYTVAELLQIDAYTKGQRPVWLKTMEATGVLPPIKIPDTARSKSKIFNAPKSNDLTEWFSEALDSINSSPEAQFMREHPASKESLVLLHETMSPQKAFDLKEVLSPNVPGNEGLPSSYSFNGKEFDYDVYGNFLFGYLAHQAGLSKTNALVAGGYAQIATREQAKGVDLHGIDSLEFFRDDRRDQAATIAGYELSKTCGINCSFKDLSEAFLKID
ncbi:MAG: filamentous hemagglutinin N-terminal domain-containing protein [Candidatus Caenarcaniphilales bacterium]|nr:filamentous hemagglutinin N-terminal domain-containing protein [Candidatus Caenarcaniphilales bacterium]